MNGHQVTLYLKSAKTLVRTETLHVKGAVSGGPSVRPGGFRFSPTYDVEKVPMYEYVLPDDQKRLLETVEEVAQRYGVAVIVVDVTRENLVERELQEHVGRISAFPTLMDDSGRRIEGRMSKEQIVSFISPLNPEKDFFPHK